MSHVNPCLHLVIKIHALSLAEVPQHVSRTFTIPGCGKHELNTEDVALVVDSVRFVMNYVAELLRVQITMTDLKPALPAGASALAVRRDESGVQYIGSFDLLVRIHCTLRQI